MLAIKTEEIAYNKISLPFCLIFAVVLAENKFVTFPMSSSISLLSCTSCAKASDDLKVNNDTLKYGHKIATP